MSKVLARSLALALSVLPASAIFESCQAQSFAQAETKAIKPMQGGEPIPASGIYYCGNVDAPIYGGNASAIEYFAPSVNSGARANYSIPLSGFKGRVVATWYSPRDAVHEMVKLHGIEVSVEKADSVVMTLAARPGENFHTYVRIHFLCRV